MKLKKSSNICNTSLCFWSLLSSVTSKKWLNVYKSGPKRFSLVKWKILTPLPKLPKMCWQFGQKNYALGFEKLPKYNKSPNLVTLLVRSTLLRSEISLLARKKFKKSLAKVYSSARRHFCSVLEQSWNADKYMKSFQKNCHFHVEHFGKYFFKWAISGLFFLIFVFFNRVVDSKQINVWFKSLPMTGCEPGPLASETTALPTEPQPLPNLVNTLRVMPRACNFGIKGFLPEGLCCKTFMHWTIPILFIFLFSK